MSSVKLAEAWLGGPPSIFWETAALIIVGIAALAIAFFTLRSATARKSLNCSIISRTRLLDAPESMRGKLRVVFGDEPALDDPYITVVEIANTGKTSIASSLFDSGRSMVFNLGAEIVQVLSVVRAPESSPLPIIVGSGSAIVLRPELIAAGEVIRASVLTRGRVQSVELALNPLSESYKISTKDREVRQRQQARTLKIASATLAVVIASEVVGVLLQANQAVNETTTALHTSIAIAKSDACAEVDESSINLTATAVLQVDDVSAMFDRVNNGLVTFNSNFQDEVAYMKAQVSEFNANIVLAAGRGINMKGSTLAVNEADELLAVVADLPSSKTVSEQKADLSQAEKLSSSVINDVTNVTRDCRHYLT